MDTLEISPNLEEISEDILVQRAKRRDEQAFCELARRSRKGCLGLAIRILHNREDAIEEVANGLCKAYSHIESLSHGTKFSSWISRIVVNYCLTRLRRARIARFVSYEDVTEDADFCAGHDTRACETPETQLGRREVDQVLRRELALIPIALRVPLELRYFQNMGLEDIARALNLTLPATKSRLHRAHGCLRRRMMRHCGSRGIGTLIRVA
jgi:RNA polymerase sigma-70 factor (ECF subfamily)